MTTFKQYSQVTKEFHMVTIHTGYWHTFLPPTRGIRFITSLEEYQEFFKCSDEELAIIKLKYGSPNPGGIMRG